MTKIGERFNEYGTLVSVHKCPDCGSEFTVCPPSNSDWGGCQAKTCISYDPKRDADKLFDESPELIERRLSETETSH